MTQSLLILGRQPKLGLAELESLFGGEQLQPVGANAALVNLAPDEIPFARLGGAIKLGKLLHEFKTTDWQPIHDYLIEILPEHLKYVPEGEKLQLGLSTYGIEISVKKQLATALALKKVAVSHKQSTRIVPNKTHELSTAQVLHNKLFTASGWELFFVRDHDRVLMAMTTNIQDIEAYTARDQNRPKRDAKVGMLPPKLAQIIVNLALGPLNDVETIDKELLDPFCGTGVVLQEALLMPGYGGEVYGTDIDPRMVDYATQNVHWLDQQKQVFTQAPRIEVADATSYTWLPTPITIACETYLGRPFSVEPKPEVLKEVIQDVNTIHKKFLQNVARQTSPGFRMCIAVPAWKTKYGFKHLPVIDHLTDMGYTRVSFANASDEELIYHREGQFVARELLVLVRR